MESYECSLALTFSILNTWRYQVIMFDVELDSKRWRLGMNVHSSNDLELKWWSYLIIAPYMVFNYKCHMKSKLKMTFDSDMQIHWNGCWCVPLARHRELWFIMGETLAEAFVRRQHQSPFNWIEWNRIRILWNIFESVKCVYFHVK